MKTKGLIAILVLLSVSSFAQQKEKRLGFELSGGASFATKDLYDAELKTGLGFEGILHYRFMPYTGIYAGWGWNKFSANESFAGKNMDFEETGYMLGLQFKHPFGTSPVSYYLRAGGLYNHIEIENKEGDITEDTGHGFGWQVAGGVDIPFGRNWSITPGVKFNSLTKYLDIEGTSTQLDMDYISVRVGVLKNF